MKILNAAAPDNPVTLALREGPRGNGDWPGYSVVYANISKAAEKMARTKYVYLSEDHINTMADLGSGHEERMKYRQLWLREFRYL